ncbi:MAG TPA: SDR family oxidoreductase [Pyrinomonadaceae bacterium]|jgi:NAD(P)-dependent dehydrogenase (short-subunit alcohol dehydrogenase family)
MRILSDATQPTEQRTESADPFEGLRVAVTGGTSGLGLALVRALVRHGARVAFVARTAERVRAVAGENPGAHGIIGDVSSKEDIYPVAVQVAGELGGLDVLVNNASDLGPIPLAMLSDTECEDFERAFQTNVFGPFRLTKALMGALAASAREGRGAVVLNVSSDAAVNAYPTWGAYGASKAALAHLTRIWGAEHEADGVRFHAIDPGDMDTPMYAAAIPGADPATLKRPAAAAREVLAAIAALLPERDSPGATEAASLEAEGAAL